MQTLRWLLLATMILVATARNAFAVPPADWTVNVKYLERRTHDEWAMSNASAAYFWAGRWIEADAKAIEPHMIRAAALLALKAPAAAIESCDAGLALNPPKGLRLFQLYMLRAGALDEVGEGEAAFNDIRRARLVASTFGDDSAEIRREADKLYWALLARMHSGPASAAQAKRAAVTGAVRLQAAMLEVRELLNANKTDDAREALRAIAGQDHAPPAAAYQFATMEMARAHRARKFSIESQQLVDWAIDRAAKLGYNDAILHFVRQQRISLELMLTPRTVALPKKPNPQPVKWFEAMLDEHAAFIKRHRDRSDELLKEAPQSLKQAQATIAQLEKALENSVDQAIWKTNSGDATASLEALAKLRTKVRAMEGEVTKQYGELQSATEAASESKDQNVREWIEPLEKARLEIDAVDALTVDTRSLLREEQELFRIIGLLDRLDARRLADGLIASLNDQSSDADVMRVTDGLIEIQAMTPSLWYRRAVAAKQSDSFHEVFVALANARIGDEAAPAYADLRKWMDDTLAEATLAPERAARERAAGRHEKALELLQRAVEVNSADGVSHLWLASLYLELGASELAGIHAELAWRCHMADPLMVKRVHEIAAQSSHWRLLFTTSSKLLRSDPLNMDLRQLRAAAAYAMGNAQSGSREISVMQAAGMPYYEGLMWYDVLGTSSFKPEPDRSKPGSNPWPEADFKNEGMPAEMRWWAMLSHFIGGTDSTARMISGASPEVKPRAELLAQYLTGKLTEQDYVRRSEAISADGYAHFAIGLRRSFSDKDDTARQHLHRAVIDESLPILYRSAAHVRIRTVWGTQPSRPLTAREPVIVGVDALTLDEAVKLARPAQWIELNTPGPHDLTATPTQSVRIRSAGQLAEVHLVGQNHPQGSRLYEYDGVHIRGKTFSNIAANNGALVFRRSFLATQINVPRGALEVIDSGTRSPHIIIGDRAVGAIRDSAIGSRVEVEGQLLIHRSALAIMTEARGKQATIIGHQVQQSSHQPESGAFSENTLKATGGARIHYIDSLVHVHGAGGYIHADASHIEVDHVISHDDPKLIIRNPNAGQVCINGPILSRFAPDRVTYEVKTTQELRATLAKAKPGDVINMVRGDYQGPIEIPAGITLQGQGSRLLASITQSNPVATIKGTGLTGLHSLHIALQSQISTRNPQGGSFDNVTPIIPLTGQAFFTALDVPTGNTVLLLGGSLSCSDSNQMQQRPFLRSLRVASGARVLSDHSGHFGNVLLEKGSMMSLHNAELSAAEISGGGSVFITRDQHRIGRRVSGAQTTFIAPPPLRPSANFYVNGAIDPRDSLDLNSASRIVTLLWKDAREQLARDVAAAPSDEALFQAIMAYERKFNLAANLISLSAGERLWQIYENVRPYLHKDALAARVVMSLQSDPETHKLLVASLSSSEHQALQQYARTVVAQYKEQLANDSIIQRMNYRHHYPPGSRYHAQAMEAHAKGKPFAQFHAEMVAVEKERQAAAARAAEATRKAQLAAAQRAEQMRQQQPAPQQPYRSGYTPTWDGSFSKHAMDSWSKLNQQSQQSMNRFYMQQYKQGFRNTLW